MYIQVFLMCLLAQFEYCIPVQPLPKGFQIHSSGVNQKSNILSLINDAGNCTAYEVLKPKLPSYSKHLPHYCDRSIQELPGIDEYIDYVLPLCMVLYDAAHRVCKMKSQEVKLSNEEGTNLKQKFVSNVFCNEISKKLPAPSADLAKPFVSLLKAKFENSSNCEKACLQGNLINPICMYILAANMFTMTTNEDISSSGNPEPQVNSQSHGKGNETNINKAKDSQKEAGEPTSAASPELSKPKQEHEETVRSDKKTVTTHKLTDHKDVHNHSEANAAITKSNSTVDMQANVTKQIHTKNSNNHSDETPGPNTAAPLKKNTKLESGAEKHEGSSEKATHPESKGSAASIFKNKPTDGVGLSDPGIQNKNVDNKESVLPTEKKSNKSQNTDMTYNMPNDDDHEQSEDSINAEVLGDQNEQGEQTEQTEQGEQDEQTEQAEQGEQIPKESEKHQEEAVNGNTAQFNQLGDAEDSHFYAYFMTMVVVCIIGYLVFHNKQKILALALEGRSRKGTRRRPNTSAYRKLDSNLEEAVTSTCSTSVTHVIY